MTVDALLVWPRSTDFPLWRAWLRAHRHFFEKIIVVFSETHHGEDYRSFLRLAMKQDAVLFIDIQDVLPGKDWRDIAVNKGLEYSCSSVVWFTEQDFISAELPFAQLDQFDLIGYRVGGRGFHPASLFVKRVHIDKTNKYFGVAPGLDHFGVFTQQLENIVPTEKICDYVHWNNNHMNGLTHNMRLVYDGSGPNYEPEKFKNYLCRCLTANTLLDVRFVALAQRYLNHV